MKIEKKDSPINRDLYLISCTFECNNYDNYDYNIIAKCEDKLYFTYMLYVSLDNIERYIHLVEAVKGSHYDDFCCIRAYNDLFEESINKVTSDKIFVNEFINESHFNDYSVYYIDKSGAKYEVDIELHDSDAEIISYLCDDLEELRNQQRMP